MAFDKNLDKALFSESVTFETTRITVSVMSYNGGAAKLQISREDRSQATGEFSFSKLGRMFKEEIDAVLPLIQKALPHMK